MDAAYPAARTALPFFQLRTHPFNMFFSGFRLLNGDGPTNPLVTRERREAFPYHECLPV